MARPDTQRKKATKFLNSMIIEYQRKNIERLPTIKELAHVASVSVVTMWNAVNTFKEQGMLDVSQRSGITIKKNFKTNASIKEQPNQVRSGPKWQRLYSKMEEDIVNGNFRVGDRLPDIQELMAKYGVCYQTAKKALDELSEQGWIENIRNKYTVASCSPSQQNEILLIAAGDRDGIVYFVTPRTRPVFHNLQNECLQHGMKLTICTFDYRVQQISKPELLTRKRCSSVLGIIVWTSIMGQPALHRLLFQLHSLKKPISIMDEGGSFSFPDVRLYKYAKVFRAVSLEQAGYELGQYLLVCGHRNIAYFTNSHGAIHCRNRYKGLCRAFKQYGLSQAVHLFAIDAKKARSVRTSHSLFKNTQSMISMLHQMNETTGIYDYEKNELSGFVKSIENRVAAHFSLVTSFERALALDTFSAWVGVNDLIAIECLMYLRNQGRNVPGNISVAAFDDTDNAHFNKLTSYNFNDIAMVQAMLNHIFNPKLIRKKRDPFVSIGGFVNVRDSTGSAF